MQGGQIVPAYLGHKEFQYGRAGLAPRSTKEKGWVGQGFSPAINRDRAAVAGLRGTAAESEFSSGVIGADFATLKRSFRISFGREAQAKKVNKRVPS